MAHIQVKPPGTILLCKINPVEPPAGVSVRNGLCHPGKVRLASIIRSAQEQFVTLLQDKSAREVPDVSLNSDYFTGYPVYCTATAAGCSSSNPWLIVGGTGTAAPLWAALMALTNEESEKGGGFNIGFVSPLLYQIASGTSYSNDFHDITSGNNDYKNLHQGKYPATPVYDLATGLGSYNAANMAADLVALTLNNSGWRSAPANTNWYFAEGAVGNGFTEYLTLQNPDPINVTNVTLTYYLQNHTPSISNGDQERQS